MNRPGAPMTEPDAMETRLTDLEIRLTHQEAALDELTRTVMRQENMIGELSRRLEQMVGILREVAASPIASEAEETPPPHY